MGMVRKIASPVNLAYVPASFPPPLLPGFETKWGWSQPEVGDLACNTK